MHKSPVCTRIGIVYGDTQLANPGTCATTCVRSYLLTGALPAAVTARQQDATPRQPIRADIVVTSREARSGPPPAGLDGNNPVNVVRGPAIPRREKSKSATTYQRRQ